MIFRAGAEYGIVNVLGCARKARTGLSIGGPEAAEAANSYTAVVEHEHLESYPVWVREEIRKKVLRTRWPDDVLMVVDRSLSKAGWNYVKEMKKKDFYHKDLELEREEGETKAFGFEWATRTGVVKVRAANQFEGDLTKEEGALRKDLPMVQGSVEFGESKRKLGAAYGRIVRVMDMTNHEGPEVVRQVGRVLGELRARGIKKQDVEYLRRRAEREAWIGMGELRKVARMSGRGAAAAMMIDDYAREVERSIEVWSEKMDAAEEARKIKALRRRKGRNDAKT